MLRSLRLQRLSAITLTVLLASEALLFAAAEIARATTVTTASDQMSTESVNASANHTITFTSPSGVSEGQTVTLTFPTAFDTSTLTEDDVDFSDDGVDLTTAATCAGSEQASVAIGGDVVTMTICAGDGGAIASGSIVVLEIGTNATASGTGAGQIVNPADGGTYLLDLGGTFADFGSIAVPILADSDLAVTATVSTGGGGGGGSGSDAEPSAETDTTAPTIENVEVTTTQDSATVDFDTDETATCVISYGTTESYGSSASEASSDTTHSLDLSDLTSGTEYFFRLTCEDESGNSSSTESSFTTTTDASPGNVSGLSCLASDSRIDFSWTMPSDDDLAGVVITCDTASYPSSASEGTTVFSGNSSASSAAVSGLINDTAYRCTAFVFDDGDNYSSGALSTCTPSAAASSEDDVAPIEETTPDETSPEETTGSEAPSDSPSSDSGEELPDGVPDGPEVSDGEGTSSEAIRLYSGDGGVELTVEDGSVDVIAGESLTIMIPSESIIAKTVADIYIIVDGQTYIIGDGDSATITAPSSGEYQATIHLVYTDGTTEDINYTFEAVSSGYVYELVDGTVSRVAGAVVTLMVSQNGSWEIANVTTSGEDGTFAWYVDNGLYRVEISKAGYEDTESGTFKVENNIATALVRLTRTPETVAEILSSDLTPLTKIIAAAESVNATIGNLLQDLRDKPEAQVAADLAVPAAIALGIGTVGLLAGAFNLWPLLQYLFTSPILFLNRRKRKAWGVVYNAGNKLPIDLAIVRMYRLDTGAMVGTRVTDRQGRYFFLAAPGEYRLVAIKPGHEFPSKILQGAKEDGEYLDVYHGEIVRVSDNEATVAANIPLDPIGAADGTETKTVVAKRVLRRLQNVTAIIGCLLALGVLVIRPSVITIIGLAAQILIYALSVRLTQPRKPKSWGIVYAAADGQALPSAVVRIFEPKYNKLLETAITDNKGRYSFLVGPSQYFTTYEKTGFEKMEVRPIDMSQQKTGEVAIDVKLNKTPPPPSQT